MAWSLNTLEVPPQKVVDAGQKTPTPMSVFNDRECQFSVIAHTAQVDIRQRVCSGRGVDPYHSGTATDDCLGRPGGRAVPFHVVG